MGLRDDLTEYAEEHYTTNGAGDIEGAELRSGYEQLVDAALIKGEAGDLGDGLEWSGTGGDELAVKGTLQFDAGAAATPSVAIGVAGLGFYETSGQLHAAIGGVEVLRVTSTGLALGAGFDPSPGVVLDARRTGGDGANIYLAAEGLTGFSFERYSANAQGPVNNLSKFRGSIAAPANISQNDILGQFVFRGYGGGQLLGGGRIQVIAIASTAAIATGDLQSRFVISLSSAGTSILAEVARFDDVGGFSMGGANPVIDQNRLHRMRSYTVATLPAAGTAGRRAMVSDALAPAFLVAVAGGGAIKTPVFDNGAAWVCG